MKKLSHRKLRRLLNEEIKKLNEGCGCEGGGEEVVNVLEPIYAPMEDAEAYADYSYDADTGPCPLKTAQALKAAGMGPQEVLQWVNEMLSSYNSEGEFSFTGDVGELGGDEAFGIGYEAGTRGL